MFKSILFSAGSFSPCLCHHARDLAVSVPGDDMFLSGVDGHILLRRRALFQLNLDEDISRTSADVQSRTQTRGSCCECNEVLIRRQGSDVASDQKRRVPTLCTVGTRGRETVLLSVHAAVIVWQLRGRICHTAPRGSKKIAVTDPMIKVALEAFGEVLERNATLFSVLRRTRCSF